jgi:hypothetical protein
MVVHTLSGTEARAVLTDVQRWSDWLAATEGNPAEIAFEADRDAWTVTVDSSRTRSTAGLFVVIATDDPFFRTWPARDVPTALRGLGAFARAGLAGSVVTDLAAIESVVRDRSSYTSMTIRWGRLETDRWLAAPFRNEAQGALPTPDDVVMLRPLDLFDKFGFDEGDALADHLGALRGEGWHIGADTLLRAVVEAGILPLLNPRPELAWIASSHNNVRAILAGFGEEIEGDDNARLAAATATWPEVVDVSSAEIMKVGRLVAGPLTARIRAVEAALEG